VNAPKRPLRRICPDCRYQIVRLSDFDGTSSLDAPEFGSRGAYDEWFHWGRIGMMWRMMASLWKQGQKQKRVQEAQRLRREVLPADPDARICPHCLRLVLSDEL
jgi:hypothetical protein